jgi:hypothetical protein
MPSRTRFGLFAVITVLGVACGGRSTIDFGLPIEATGGAGSGGLGATGGTDFGGTSGTGTGGTLVGGSGGDGGTVSGGAGGTTGFCDAPANECEACTCKGCANEWEACVDDVGCAEIVACADKTGCSGIDCYLGACQSVIDQNGGLFGPSTSLAQGIASCRNQNNCACGGGSGGAGGTGGFGGGPSGGGGAPSGGGGTGGTGPLACIMCINQQCPAVQECIFDQACRDGAICAFQSCMSGGSPNLQCMLGCFNGDFTAAFKAFQSFQCFFSQCGQQCGGSIPGLPGFGGAGGN